MATMEADLREGEPGFIFVGTVRRLGASTVQFPIDGPTAVVSVDEILRALGDLRDLAGTLVTVTGGKEGLKEGQQWVFLTNGWLYGDGIAVVELGREQDISAARKRLVEDDMEEPEGPALHERIQGAELIVMGRVREMRPLESERPLLSEHNPEWWEAVIEIEETLKGQPPEKTVGVAFPSSRDVMWHASPKPQPGQEGVWLLRRGDLVQGPGERYTALHPLDFQPKEQLALERLRRITG